MKTFAFEPLLGIRNSIQFGMSREAARAVLAPDRAQQFSRGDTPVDAFHESSLQLSYDRDERVEFIEFARGVRVLLDGYDLFGSEAESVIEYVKKKHQLEEDSEPGYSFCFPEIELGFWRQVLPEAGSDAGRYFDSAGFGRAGYYSKAGRPDGTDNSEASPISA